METSFAIPFRGHGEVLIVDGHPVCDWRSFGERGSGRYQCKPNYNKRARDNISWRIYVTSSIKGEHSITINVPKKCIDAAYGKEEKHGQD